MKRMTIIILLLQVIALSSFGQEPEGFITAKKSFGSYQYFQNGERIYNKQFAALMKTNESANKEYLLKATSL